MINGENGEHRTWENFESGGPRPVDNDVAQTQLSKSGAVLGLPGRLHGAYGMVVDSEQGVTPSGRERVIRGLDPGTLPYSVQPHRHDRNSDARIPGKDPRMSLGPSISILEKTP